MKFHDGQKLKEICLADGSSVNASRDDILGISVAINHETPWARVTLNNGITFLHNLNYAQSVELMPEEEWQGVEPKPKNHEGITQFGTQEKPNDWGKFKEADFSVSEQCSASARYELSVRHTSPALSEMLAGDYTMVLKDASFGDHGAVQLDFVTKRESPWISVEERMPDEGQRVITYCEGRPVDEATCRISLMGDPHLVAPNGGVETSVTHWMLYPPMPEGE